METILVHPENAEQLTVIKAFLKALKIPFEPMKNYQMSLTKADIDEAYKEMREGKYTVIKTDDLWK